MAPVSTTAPALDFHSPGWHGEAQTPVVDGKYVDRRTGEVRTASGHEEYSGPPAVDIIIMSLHEDTNEHIFRAARSFPMEALLHQMMKVVHARKLTLDSLSATTYSIRVILAHELTREEFGQVYDEMANGLFEAAG